MVTHDGAVAKQAHRTVRLVEGRIDLKNAAA
jgi:predicted ABC-type transport system involved in lysophospholipase L1 biosynthesis ATPase subunit